MIAQRASADGFESLCIKSTDPHDKVTSGTDAAHAVLCTERETFQIRQVQSSNSLFVLRPVVPEHSLPRIGVCAVAQCPSTLELVSTKPAGETFWKTHLPVYSKTRTEVQIIKRHRLIADAPLSRAELDDSWYDMCCFEEGEASYMPTDKDILQVWSLVLDTASMRGLGLDTQLDTSAFFGEAEAADLPLGLLSAVFLRLQTDSGSHGKKGELDDDHLTLPFLQSGSPNKLAKKPKCNFSQFHGRTFTRLPESQLLAGVKSLTGPSHHNGQVKDCGMDRPPQLEHSRFRGSGRRLHGQLARTTPREMAEPSRP